MTTRLLTIAVGLAALLVLQARPVAEGPVPVAKPDRPAARRVSIPHAAPLFAAPLPAGPAAMVWPPDNPAFERICAVLGLDESDAEQAGFRPAGAGRECVGQPDGGAERAARDLTLFAMVRGPAAGGRTTVRLKLTVRDASNREAGRQALIEAAAPVLALAGIDVPLRFSYLPDPTDPLDLTIGRHRVRLFREAGEGEHYNLMLSLPKPPRPPFAEAGAVLAGR